MTKFTYNGKIYNPVNLEKKLRKMGITINDIDIIPEKEKIIEYDTSIIKHHFKLPNGYTITSIYDNLNHLNISEYEQID